MAKKKQVKAKTRLVFSDLKQGDKLAIFSGWGSDDHEIKEVEDTDHGIKFLFESPSIRLYLSHVQAEKVSEYYDAARDLLFLVKQGE